MQGVRCQSSAVVAPDFCCCTWKKLVESLTAALRLIWHAPSWCWRSISKQWVWCNWPKAMCYVSWSFEAWRPCMPFLWRVSLLTPRLGCTWAMVGCETRVVASKISTRSTHDLGPRPRIEQERAVSSEKARADMQTKLGWLGVAYMAAWASTQYVTVCLPNSMAHSGNNITTYYYITVQSRSLKQVPPPSLGPGFKFQCFQPMDSNGGSKKAWQWPMMRGDARCKSTPLYRIHVGCIRPWLKRFGKPMQIPCWRRHVPWSAQTLYSSMIVIFHEFELIAVVCEDFSYHPFRLAACSPEEMLEP